MKVSYALAVVITAMLAIGQAVADKPSWAGGGKGANAEDQEEWDDDGERSEGIGCLERPDFFDKGLFKIGMEGTGDDLEHESLTVIR